MADQASIFGNDSTQQQAAPSTPGTGGTPPNDELATLLGNIKNERGEPKYKTVAEALNALKHSQEFIPTLKNSNQELEQKLNEAMEKLQRVSELERTVNELTQRTAQAPNQPAGMSQEQVAELVNRTLTTAQRQAVEKQNVDTVTSAVKEAFGDKAEEVFYGKAQEIGLSREEFNALAAKTPKAVLDLLGVGKTQTQRSSSPTINTDGFQTSQVSFLGRNTKTVLLGASSHEVKEEAAAAASLVNELHSQGKSVYDLTDPKAYFKYFQSR